MSGLVFLVLVCQQLLRLGLSADMSFFDRLKRFDAYPKTLEDFRVKTFSGAAVSLTAIAIIVILVASELSY